VEEQSSSGGGGTLAILALVALGVIILTHSGNVHIGRVTQSSASITSVTQQIDAVFGNYSTQAESIARCESSLNPSAYNPEPVYVNGVAEHAQGLFQIIPSTFHRVSNGDVYNAQDNIQAAYAIFKQDGYRWSEWECQP